MLEQQSAENGSPTHKGTGETDRTFRNRIVAFALLAYVVTVGSMLLYWNAAGGGMVEGWYRAYVGPRGQIEGSGKWRDPEGKAFQDMALLFGLWVYPLSLVAAGLFARLTWQSKGVGKRAAFVVCGFAALYVLYRFLKLGLFTAVTSF
jgi:hypothetical protein